MIHRNTLKFQDKPILRTGQKSSLQHSLFWRYANFCKLMRTIHVSMTRTFLCEYCQCFTFKRCNKFKLKCTSHEGMYNAHYFGKKKQRQSSECCNAHFWQVRGIELSWNFKVLQWVNPNESFRHYYIHYEDYVKRFLKNSFESFQRYSKKTLKDQSLNEVALIQVVRKQASLQDRKNKNTPKFPSIKI